ncbi:sulfotransferase family protein [Ideonella paludis]|uniref:Sulfotransferase n=2 Tax=Ideonella paludis TaxID=1233411 RepID=A0ABS5DRV8_9BURK|nr:sulfotransferase [Ideonella paludis]MBQ0933779.1 sulfotransferase [Ideonella paludis]
MLRDALRLHDNLGCPEETHFFRWGDPFGTDALNRTLSNNQVLKKHRELDGVTEDEFRELLAKSNSRADLYHRYMRLYLAKNKPSATRWFDKTPQNVYGAMLIATTMPRVKFVHIVRDPRNVAASLRIGKVVKVESIVGSANYWHESVQIIKGLKRAFPERVHELRYEDFVANPLVHIESILSFLGEPFNAATFADLNIRNSDHAEESLLTPEELQRLESICQLGMKRYKYKIEGPTSSSQSTTSQLSE